MTAERRKHYRATLPFLVQFRSDSFEDFLSEYARNISAGGMFIRTDEPREQGALISVQFLLRDGSRLIDGLARVVRVAPPPGTAAEPAGMGVEFQSLDAESVSVIAEVVEHNRRREVEEESRQAGLGEDSSPSPK